MVDNNLDGMNDRHKSKIEEAQEKLDSKYVRVKQRPRTPMHEKHYKVPDEWASEPVPPKRTTVSSRPLFQNIFIGSLIFFLAAMGVAAFSLFGGRNIVSTDAIDMEILARAFADGGEALDITVEITNENNAPLELADLILTYPKSSVEDGEMVREPRKLGTIRPGQTVVEEFEVVLFGEEGEERSINATLEYRVEGSNAIFVKESFAAVALQSTPIQLTLNAPDTVTENQEIELEFNVISNATTTTQSMLLQAEYPSGFIFEEAEPEPSLGNSVWFLGDIPAGADRVVTVRGTMRGQSGEERVFRGFVGEQDPNDEREIITAFNSDVHTLAIERPFLGATILIDQSEDEEVPVNSTDKVRVDIEWENTLPDRLRDVEVTARLSGSAYNRSSVETLNGFFDSPNDVILWSSDTIPALQSVEPGSSGRLTFNFTPRPLVSGLQVIDQPQVVIDVDVRGLDGNGAVRSASGVTQKRALVNSNLQLTQRTQHFGGPFTNNGPYPPQAEQSTDFTIVWNVTNTSNLVDDAKVTTSLPSYVTWENRVTPSNEDLSYNPVKREVTWNLGMIDAGTGFATDAREVAFQVSITPSLSQVNFTPELTTDVILSGDDRFTEVLLRTIRRAHSTRLLNDIQSGGGRVE